MMPALATLATLAAIWMAVVIIARMVGESGGKILAALNGRSELATEHQLSPVPVRISQRARLQRTLRAKPRWRAAA